jgi:hypothetical protein
MMAAPSVLKIPHRDRLPFRHRARIVFILVQKCRAITFEQGTITRTLPQPLHFFGTLPRFCSNIKGR